MDRIFSQELRLNSPEGAPLKWVVGAHYFQSDYEAERFQTSSVSPYSTGNFDTRIDARTLAVFGDATLPLTEALKISGGLRLAHDRQKLEADYRGIGFPGSVDAYSQRSDISASDLTGRLALAYDWSDDVMSYASVSRGYASGGFPRHTLNSVVGRDTEPFRPAKGWSYEIGAKADLGGRVRLGAAAFHNAISDGQLVAVDAATPPMTFHFVNQDYSSSGVELEAQASLTPALTIGGGVGWTRSRLGDAATPSVRAGGRAPNTPEFTANLDVSYRFGQGFELAAQYQYVGERAMDVANSGDLPAEHRINAKLGWSDGKWEVYGFVENLLDERPLYFGSAYSPQVHSVVTGAGRRIGLGGGVSF